MLFGELMPRLAGHQFPEEQEKSALLQAMLSENLQYRLFD